jgi:hypothetical protein
MVARTGLSSVFSGVHEMWSAPDKPAIKIWGAACVRQGLWMQPVARLAGLAETLLHETASRRPPLWDLGVDQTVKFGIAGRQKDARRPFLRRANIYPGAAPFVEPLEPPCPE